MKKLIISLLFTLIGITGFTQERFILTGNFHSVTVYNNPAKTTYFDIYAGYVYYKRKIPVVVLYRENPPNLWEKYGKEEIVVLPENQAAWLAMYVLQAPKMKFKDVFEKEFKFELFSVMLTYEQDQFLYVIYTNEVFPQYLILPVEEGKDFVLAIHEKIMQAKEFKDE